MEQKIENGKIVELCVAAVGDVVAGSADSEDVGLMMLSKAAVAIMTAIIEVEVAVMMMMMVVGEEGVLAVVTTDMMVLTAADIADSQV